MRLPEDLQQLLVGHDGRVEDDADDLGMTGTTRAHLAVCRIRRLAAGVPGGRRPHAGRLPEQLLGAPEAAQAEDRLGVPGRDVPLDRVLEDGMRAAERERSPGAAGQGLARAGQRGLGTAEEHGYRSSRTGVGSVLRTRYNSTRPSCHPAAAPWLGAAVMMLSDPSVSSTTALT